MRNPTTLTGILGLMLVTAVALAMPTAVAQGEDDNRGTLKVHDNATADPEERNEPHVTCDFWIQGFNMKDPSGWLVFIAWPPTGNKTNAVPTGDTLNWTGTPDGDGEYDFTKGPYFLDPGHYRVEAYTDDGHPGHEHFAKDKLFWVDECVVIPFFPGFTALALGSLGALAAVGIAVMRRR